MWYSVDQVSMVPVLCGVGEGRFRVRLLKRRDLMKMIPCPQFFKREGMLAARVSGFGMEVYGVARQYGALPLVNKLKDTCLPLLSTICIWLRVGAYIFFAQMSLRIISGSLWRFPRHAMYSELEGWGGAWRDRYSCAIVEESCDESDENDSMPAIFQTGGDVGDSGFGLGYGGVRCCSAVWGVAVCP